MDISEEAYDGWRRMAEDAGVTVTALIEAIGLRLAAGQPLGDAGLAAAVKEARSLDVERRRRGKS